MKKEKGFTLLELIIVMFLISLIAAVSTALFVNTLPTGKFNATAREVAVTIKHARALAQITGERQIVAIDLDAKKYGIEGRGERDIPKDTEIKVIDPFLGEVVNGKYHLVFYAGGRAEGGTIVLRNKNKSATIYMDPIVGSVLIK